LQNHQPLDVCRNPAYETSGLIFLPPSTLQVWEFQLKGVTKADKEGNLTTVTGLGFDLDHFKLDIGDGILRPMLSGSKAIPALTDRRTHVGDKPTGVSLTSLVTEHVPLDEKQQLVVGRVLSEAFAWAEHAYDAS
jgi:hypothetical protein